MSVIDSAPRPVILSNKSRVAFAGNVTKLNDSTVAATGKDTALFIDRGDVSVDAVASQAIAGDSILLTGPGGSGKSLFLQETLRRLEAQGVPTFPKKTQATGLMLKNNLGDLTQFLEVNRGEKPVVVGLDEVAQSFFVPGIDAIDILKGLQRSYPNARFVATMDSMATSFYEPHDPEMKFIDSTFGQRHRLQPLNNWYEQLTAVLNNAGFTIPAAAQGRIAEYLRTNFVPNSLGIREFIVPMVDALRAQLGRQDSDQPEELSQDVLTKGFPKLFS